MYIFLNYIFNKLWWNLAAARKLDNNSQNNVVGFNLEKTKKVWWKILCFDTRNEQKQEDNDGKSVRDLFNTQVLIKSFKLFVNRTKCLRILGSFWLAEAQIFLWFFYVL